MKKVSSSSLISCRFLHRKRQEKKNKKLEQIRGEDFEVTCEKRKQFFEERGRNAKMDVRLAGLIICPVCEKVFMNSEWKGYMRHEK